MSEALGVALAQAHAETKAWDGRRDRFGVSYKQGHRRGWRDGIEWIVRSHQVHWEARVLEVWPRLLVAGIIGRTPADVDHAIDSARSALQADDAVLYDPETTHGWEVLEPHVLRFLDLTDDELAAVA